MSSEQVIIPMENVSKKEAKSNLDMSTVEMVFGTPDTFSAGEKDTHLIDNEKGHTEKNNRQRNNSDAQPLLERKLPRPLPPLAGPEIDDLEDQKPDQNPFPDELEPGISTHSTPDLISGGDEDKFNGVDHELDDHHHDDGKWGFIDGKNNGLDETDFYYGGGIDNRFGEDRPISPFPSAPGSIPDVNTYQQKKNLAQGMMDLALLSANANQLRYVLESSENHPYYYFSLVFISLSIIFQILVGIGLIMNSRYNVKDEKDICKADKINNATVLGIFLVTIVNVFITSFSVASPTRQALTPTAPVAGGG